MAEVGSVHMSSLYLGLTISILFFGAWLRPPYSFLVYQSVCIAIDDVAE